jgi:hypothetical protein
LQISSKDGGGEEIMNFETLWRMNYSEGHWRWCWQELEDVKELVIDGDRRVSERDLCLFFWSPPSYTSFDIAVYLLYIEVVLFFIVIRDKSIKLEANAGPIHL